MADPDFGTDLDWADDLDPSGRMISGARLLGQAAFHRLITPRGACLDAPDDGLDVAEFLSLGLTPTEKTGIPGQIAAELRKDERFLDAEVEMTDVPPDGFRLKIRITPSAGPEFDLVLSVSAAATKLVSITNQGVAA